MKSRNIIIACILLMLVLFVSCSAYSGDSSRTSSNNSSSDASGAPSAGRSDEASAPGDANTSSSTAGSQQASNNNSNSSAGGNGSASSYASSDSNTTYNSTEQGMAQLPNLTPSEAAGKKLVYTLTLRLQTTEFMQGLRTLINTVSDIGGYLMSVTIEGRDMRETDVERKGDYEFRIPTERLQDLLVVVEDNYNIFRLQQTAEDVTPAYNRSGIRVEDLFAQEERLIAALGAIEDAEERLDTERMLADVQKLISELVSYRISVDDSVKYATVFVQLYEVIIVDEVEEEEEIVEPDPPPTFSERVGDRVQASMNAFTSFCQGLLLFIIAIAPALVVIAIIGVFALVVWRFVKRSRMKRGKRGKLTVSALPSEQQGAPEYDDSTTFPPQK